MHVFELVLLKNSQKAILELATIYRLRYRKGELSARTPCKRNLHVKLSSLRSLGISLQSLNAQMTNAISSSFSKVAKAF